MNKSLIAQVEQLEQEASLMIADAKKTSENELLHVSKSMHEAREAITAKADATSAQIIAEHTKQATEEAHRIMKESNDAASITHNAAEKNRDRAIKKATQLFAETYSVPLA
ncbi:MAG: hypothetical protein A3E36_01360 [Candidatus Andersenbacteria bacterium RIFCSPHIGHO2_12_FULL_45_11b]|uniref:Uncharacterized protein n=1 Tax=Candidatus Andersenbacteria bacterium RIFCSPHIGHO2_12_FULL_45_11b TaxID=1797282 RepID=A0A1G1XBL1_9BACT|nr:MAG: hypothetical protein A3E36_01360 [Candidatus Andersenbacteria bacterium RIFCSPHIGHO2_12_FULL_45_11b]